MNAQPLSIEVKIIMAIFTALVFIIIGGMLNGSFALPTKNIKHWYFENIWLNYSIWSFIILPWLSIFVLAPHIGAFYQHLPIHFLLILLGGGLVFGAGQACFAQALKLIGFGLGFVINIGLGTGLGFLLPLVVLHPEKIFTLFGLTTLAGIVLIILGLIISYRAGKKRDRDTQHLRAGTSPNQYQNGVILAVLAGLGSALQNFTFAATQPLQILAIKNGFSELASSMVIWPIFLSFSFIPYFLYMIYLLRKNQTFHRFRSEVSGFNSFMALVMALFWYSSLILYSEASLLIGGLGPIVGWPLFMVLIILMANFWGWRHHEWAHVSKAISRLALSAIGLLILAVLVLAYSATLS